MPAAGGARRLACAVAVWAALVPGPWGQPDPLRPGAPAETLVLSAELAVRVRSGREVDLRVQVRPEETWAALAQRTCGDASGAASLAAWNGAEPRSAPAGDVHVPLALLSPELRRLVLGSLFPRDRRDGADWIHVARSGPLPVYGEGLWQVAAWFTGSGAPWEELRRVNGLASPELSAGQEVRIPAALLAPAFAARPTSEDGTLEYAEDAQGRYAGYRIRAGEALYTSVILRYTGRTSAEDVRAAADELARRSDIRTVTDIPVGWVVKIPFDLLEPEFLPPDHPARREVEAASRERAAELARAPVAATRHGLEGVVVVLDPGHGGRDLGNMNHGLWEHDYVYDVACRLKRWLEGHTRARVLLTLEDEVTGTVPSDALVLQANQQGTVRTSPPFLAREVGEAAMGVHLRWYLANALYRQTRAAGVAADRVVFLSLHADARHPSLRGAMVYVPAASLCEGPHGFDTPAYRVYREVREAPRVRFSRKELVRSEAVSRQLASAIVRQMRAADLPVHAIRPVRDRVLRGSEAWVPAVLRGNAIPSKVLVELVNMGNLDDAALLAGGADRERLARALGAALFVQYGETPPGDALAGGR